MKITLAEFDREMTALCLDLGYPQMFYVCTSRPVACVRMAAECFIRRLDNETLREYLTELYGPAGSVQFVPESCL